MKFIKKTAGILDRLLGNTPEAKPYVPLTREEERDNMLKAAQNYESRANETSSKYQNIGNSIFKTPEKIEYTDREEVVQAATKILSKALKKMGADGNDLHEEEMHVTASHTDKIDNKTLTDKATISFKGVFATAKNPKNLRFVVNFDYDSDARYTVADKFYDEFDNEYKLTSEALINCLENGDVEEMNKQAKVNPLAVYNYETESMEVIPTTESTARVASRLKASGYNVTTEYVDRTRGPQFGKLCYCVHDVSDIAALKVEAALSDDEWINRSQEGQREAKEKQTDLAPSQNWINRTEEKGSSVASPVSHKELGDKNKTEWVERTKQTSDVNPYKSEKTVLLMSQGSKKEDEGKKVEAALNKLNIDEELKKFNDLLK